MESEQEQEQKQEQEFSALLDRAEERISEGETSQKDNLQKIILSYMQEATKQAPNTPQEVLRAGLALMTKAASTRDEALCRSIGDMYISVLKKFYA